MDPVLQSVFLGLFVNGLSSLIGSAGKKICKYIPKSKSLNSILSGNEFNQMEKLLMKEVKNIGIKSIDKFLESTEVESIVRQIYALEITEESFNPNYSTRRIKREFDLLFSRYFGMSEEKTKSVSLILFEILLLGCHEVFKKEILSENFYAENSKFTIEANVLSDQIAIIQKNTELLLAVNEINVKKIHEFEEDYLRSIEKRHELIRSITYETRSRVPFNEIYVKPNLKRLSLQQHQYTINRNNYSSLIVEKVSGFRFTEEKEISLEDFLSKAYRAVILGDPGSGKTTLAKKLCYDLAKHHSERLYFGRKVIPVLVTLREYQSKNIEANISILDYITKESNSSYQISVPVGAFEYLLLNGYIIVIFDGLDELLEMSLRENIVDKIESFCTRYPSVPVIVTSRKVGYEQAPLNAQIFEKFELSSFNNEQVTEYVNKWFALDPDLTESEKLSKANSFLEESEIVEDIRSNCLMLSLMCSIYREENYIPENRPQIYQKCAEMLFDRWDKHRGIIPKLYIPMKKIKPLVDYLAYSIFTSESFQEGINESKLIDKSIEYLYTFYEDRDEAELAAKDFISFCKDRAWVLTEIGSTKKGEGIYNFTHQTFLEYFTADWIIRKNTLEDISELLLDKICEGKWDVVAQLVFQIKCENSEDGENLLLKLINYSEIKIAIARKFNLLSFSARCLEFIVPSPKITREITNACFKFIINTELDLITQIQSEEADFEFFDYNYNKSNRILESTGVISYFNSTFLPSFKSVKTENLNTIGSTLKELISITLSQGDEKSIYVIAELCLLMGACYEHDSKKILINSDFWLHLSKEILSQLLDLHVAVLSYYRNVFNGLYNRSLISLDDFIRIFGLESIFCGYSYLIETGNWNGIARNSMINFLESTPNFSELTKIGSLFLSNLFPVTLGMFSAQNHDISSSLVSNLLASENINLYFKKNNDWFFGIFCLFACAFELNSPEITKVIIKDFHMNKMNDPKTFLQKIILTKIEKPKLKKIWDFKPEIIEKEIEEINLSENQKSVILNWISGNMHFLILNEEVNK